MLKKDFFKRNRKNFIEKLNPDSLAIFFSRDKNIKGDSEYFDFSDNNLFYLTGIEESNTKYFVWKNKDKIEEYLFIEKANPKKEIWEGKKLNKSDAKKVSGINNIKYLEEFNPIFNNAIKKSKNIYFAENKKYNNSLSEYDQFIMKIKTKYKKNYLSSIEILKDLREIKSKEELDQIKKAIQITKKGFDDVLKRLKDIKTENEIEAILTYNYIKEGAKHAYHPIVASSADSCTLHYIKNNKKLIRNDLILIDSGAEINNYKSDITRTYPISGKFTKRQGEVYLACLEVQKYAIKAIKVGINRQQWEKKVHIKMAEKLKELRLLVEKDVEDIKKVEKISDSKSWKKLKKYYPHSTGHFLGLDTHDLGSYDEPFKENQIYTIEPGIYIKEEKIGVRIEDNVLITKTGCFVLSKNIPKEIKAIEFQNRKL